MNKLFACIPAVLTTAAIATAAPAPYTERPQTAALVEKLQSEHGLDPAWVRKQLAQAEFQPHIIAAMRRPAEKMLPWHEYRQIFLDPERIEGGAAFVREHADIFTRAEREYGVPAAMIAAIIGVETRYGRFTGRDRVLDALATLGFDYPERANFFRSELGHFLVLAHEEDLDVNTVTGSYAGAMGLGQFIPSSYRAYAVDFDGNGRRDLWDEPADAIGSVANYLSEHGWRAGEPVVLPGRVSGTGAADLERSNRKTRYSYRELAAAGVEAPQPPDPDTRTGLVELEGENGPEYWIGLHNFFVITSYNHSRLYAMAVYQLYREIEQRLAENPERSAQP